MLLKISGEVLGGKTGGICPESVHAVAAQVREVARLGVQIGVVVGGGNIFRGLQGSEKGIERATGDYMGMLATVINSMALQDALEKQGVPTRVQSAISMSQVAEPFIRRRAVRHLEKGRVVIFGGGTGNPYCSTDTAAALRANEIGAEVILKATKVDGIYDSDPMKNPKAKRFATISYLDALQKRLKIMGLNGILAVHGQRHADHRLRPLQKTQLPQNHPRRQSRHAGELRVGIKRGGLRSLIQPQ